MATPIFVEVVHGGAEEILTVTSMSKLETPCNLHILPIYFISTVQQNHFTLYLYGYKGSMSVTHSEVRITLLCHGGHKNLITYWYLLDI